MNRQDNTEVYSFAEFIVKPLDQNSGEPEFKTTMANSICTSHTVDVAAVYCLLHWPAYAATLREKE